MAGNTRPHYYEDRRDDAIWSMQASIRNPRGRRPDDFEYWRDHYGVTMDQVRAWWVEALALEIEFAHERALIEGRKRAAR